MAENGRGSLSNAASLIGVCDSIRANPANQLAQLNARSEATGARWWWWSCKCKPYPAPPCLSRPPYDMFPAPFQKGALPLPHEAIPLLGQYNSPSHFLKTRKFEIETEGIDSSTLCD